MLWLRHAHTSLLLMFMVPHVILRAGEGHYPDSLRGEAGKGSAHLRFASELPWLLRGNTTGNGRGASAGNTRIPQA